MRRTATRLGCHHRILLSRKFLLVTAALISLLAFSTTWQEFGLMEAHAVNNKEYSGTGWTINEGLERAVEAAYEDHVRHHGSMVMFYVLKDVRGSRGGFVYPNQVTVTIAIDETKIMKGELCSEVAQYEAFQRGNTVTLLAFGSHNTAGYEVYLRRSPIEIFPPQYILTHVEPSGAVPQVITPFATAASFPSKDKIEEVVVQDAKGSHKIKVEQIPLTK